MPLPCCDYAAQNAILVFSWDIDARSDSFMRRHAKSHHNVPEATLVGRGMVSDTAYAIAILSSKMKQYDSESVAAQIRTLKGMINANLHIPFIFTRFNVHSGSVISIPDRKILDALDDLPANCLLPPCWRGFVKDTHEYKFWPTDKPMLTLSPTTPTTNGGNGACGADPNNPSTSVIIHVEDPNKPVIIT